MTITQVLAVAAGGATGAVARFLLVSAIGRWFGHGFPWGTLTVNILGSCLMGLLVEWMALKWPASLAATSFLSPVDVRSFLAVGMLGAFTTFSTFSLDVITLVQRQEWQAAAGYCLGSFVLSVGALFIGLRLGRVLFG